MRAHTHTSMHNHPNIPCPYTNKIKQNKINKAFHMGHKEQASCFSSARKQLRTRAIPFMPESLGYKFQFCLETLGKFPNPLGLCFQHVNEGTPEIFES